MNRFSRKYYPAVFAAALCMLALAACTADDAAPLPQGPTYHAGFYVSVGEIAAEKSSRAPSGTGSYHPGEGLENYIDLENDFRVVLFTPGDTLLGEMTDFFVIPVESTPAGKRYYVEASTDIDISTGKFKVAVLANWGTYPAELTFDNIFAQTYDFKSAALAADNTIPLYGVKEVKLPEIEPFKAVNIGTIHLLRAFAKIEVIFDDPSGKWHFSKLQLSHYNKKGFNAPTDITDESGYKKDNWTDDYTTFLSIPADKEVGEGLDFVDVGDNHHVVYVPEYDNNTNTNEQASIIADFEESFLGERSFVLRKDDVPLDFKRNVWYKVTIKKKPEQTEMDITVDVIPYKLVDLCPSFGLDEPEESENPETPETPETPAS